MNKTQNTGQPIIRVRGLRKEYPTGDENVLVLKDIDLDVIKLDMRFLSKTTQSGRGGTILSSVVRMAKWMNLPVIAEGVETAEQADFLRSIGCEYIQGYLYAKPMPENEYETLLSGSHIGFLRQPEQRGCCVHSITSKYPRNLDNEKIIQLLM